MYLHTRLLRAAVCASFTLTTVALTGCSDAGTATTNPTPALAKGNWQIGSTVSAAARLASFSGELTPQAGALTGIFHTQSATACSAPATSFEVAGAADSNNLVTLTGPLAGGTLTLTGTLAPDGKSLTDATYTVAGGACALPRIAATAQAFTPIAGHYTGNFGDASGQVAQVSASFAQSPAADPNGNFTLSGSATVTGDPCFPSAVPISDTQVTGGTFTFTYSANGNSVTANGNFSADAATLTVTGWTSTGTCGADTGVQSTMTRQAS